MTDMSLDLTNEIVARWEKDFYQSDQGYDCQFCQTIDCVEHWDWLAYDECSEIPETGFSWCTNCGTLAWRS